MPKRRQKRDDTSNSDDYDEQDKRLNKRVHFGTVQINRFVPPDQIQGDDATRYSILAWSNTLYAQRLLPWNERKQLFKRALIYLPYSYKIWHMYLTEYTDFCSTRSIMSKQYTYLNQTFQDALERLPKMPRIWMMYCESLQKQHLISKVRAVYNWSFRNLPVTQHQKIWHKFSVWSMKLDNSSTALKVIPRYIKLNPDFKQVYVDYLKQRGYYDMCIKVIQDIIADDGYHSKAGKNKKDFNFDIIELITEFPDKIKSINGQIFLRQSIQKFSNEQGKLWVKLSDYFVRYGQFQKARQTFEQALEKIDNAKDFGVIFNAYCKFQEEMITALGNEEIQQYADVHSQDNVQFEIQRRMKKLQSLIDRQPYMLYNIQLKRAPYDIKSWIGLSQLYQKAGDFERCLQTIEKGIQNVDSQKVQNGKLSQLWIKLSKLYQQKGQFRQCNQILYQASQVNYKMVEDYFNIWIRWAEMLLEQHYYQDALKVLKHVLFKRKTQPSEQLKIKNIEDLLKTNITLWQLYIDIQISIGTFQQIKTAYQRCKQHKCLTPIMLINFTNFLWSNAYFEETFRVFEFAVGSFKWPSLYQIWISYIHKFIDRYGDDPIGVQRARSMFERLLKQTPKQYSGIFYYLYAKFEQQHGMISNAINIYDSMVNTVPINQRSQAYIIYICKVAKMLGITKTRAIFQTALQKLSEKQVLKIGVQYALLQTNLGQIQRARAVYVYISQFTDPRDDLQGLWNKWQSFQVEFGDKDTYKQYLRVQRSVEAKFQMLPPDLEKIQAKVQQGLL